MHDKVSKIFDLRGKRALVTGASRGLGYAMAQALGDAGAVVVLNARHTGPLQTARKALGEAGIEAHVADFDVADGDRVDAVVKRIEENIGPIDILVNNAGINRRAPAADCRDDDWQRVLDVNLNGPFHLCRAVGRGMISRRRGKIVNVTSLLSEAARPGIAPYTVSKGALKMFTKALAVEWGPYNIQVNAIGPGYFDTDMNAPLVADPEFDRWVRSNVPAGRWGKPEDLAGAAVFFASSASDFVTGQTLFVDGGWLANL